MSHTNSTANFGLPQYIGTDKPTYLGDENGAYLAIDTQMKKNQDLAQGAQGTADTALTIATEAKDNATEAQRIANTKITNGAGTVTSENLAENAINSSKIATGSINSDKIANKAITLSKVDLSTFGNQYVEFEGDVTNTQKALTNFTLSAGTWIIFTQFMYNQQGIRQLTVHQTTASGETVCNAYAWYPANTTTPTCAFGQTTINANTTFYVVGNAEKGGKFTEGKVVAYRIA